MLDEPKIRSAVTRRITHPVVPLHQARSVRHRAFLLRPHGGWEEEHLGRDVSGRQFALLDQTAFCQKLAVSVMAKSRTTSHSSLAKPRCTSSEFTAPTTGFCPNTNLPLTTPSTIARVIGICEWSPVSLGRWW